MGMIRRFISRKSFFQFESDYKNKLIILFIVSFLSIIRFYHWGLYGFLILFLFSLKEMENPWEYFLDKVKASYGTWAFIIYVGGRILMDSPGTVKNYHGILTPLVVGLLTLIPSWSLDLSVKIRANFQKWFYIRMGIALIPQLVIYKMTGDSLILKNTLCLASAAILMGWQGRKSIGILLFVMGVSLLGGARTNLLALMVALCVVEVARLKPKLTCSLLIASVTFYFFVMWGWAEFICHNPLSHALAEKLRSFHERTVVWDMATALYHKNPWWGIGPYSVSKVLTHSFSYMYQGSMWNELIRHPHNILLEVKASLGSVGCFLLWGALIQQIMRMRHRPDVATGLATGVYALIMFSGYLSFFRDPWFLGWIGILTYWQNVFFSTKSISDDATDALSRKKREF
jgi:O-antigen ligase